MESMQAAFSALNRAMQTHTRVSTMSFDFGVGRPLSPDEIHAIAAVDAERGSTIAEMAEALGKTGQETGPLADQLCNDGLLEKKEGGYRLTEQGLRAQENHLGFHIERDKHFLAYIASLDEDAFAQFSETCRQMEQWMDSYLS
jgi:DNA-binding MarR family transcriptional regulator